ncbi:MAG: hypothetical protein U0V75_04800 [Ferruginibacter sp.]
MRTLFLLGGFFLLCCSLPAQKAAPSKPAAAKNTRPATDSIPLTESLVFAKLGKTKITAHFLKTFPSPALERNKEVLYFLYEHFNDKQVQRIIRLAERRTMATMAGYDSVQKRGDAFTAYLVKPYRHIWPSDSTKFTEMALLYIPYSEKENFNDLYTIKPETAEGIFISADYTVLETENMAKLPPVPKWEQKSLFSLPSYKATHKEEAQPVVVQAAPAEKLTPKQLAKYTLEDIVAVFKKLAAAADIMNLITDNINAATSNRFKGPGNTVTTEGMQAARDIKSNFNRCIELYAAAKKSLESVKEDRLSGTVCDNTYYIYKAKDKMHSNLVDIVFEKDFLKTFIDIAQTDGSSYSLWMDNIKNLQTRYKERMLQYAKDLSANTSDLKEKCLSCLEQVGK